MGIKGFDAWGSSSGPGLEPKKAPVKATVEPTAVAKPATVVKVRRPGRPRIGEVPERPWEAAGMSERTWYRRQREKKDE